MENEKKSKIEKVNLGYPLGYLFSAFTAFSCLSIPFLQWKFGLLGYFIAIFNRQLCHLIDIKTSNATLINMKCLEKNGYDGWKIMKKSVINNVINGTGVYFIWKFLFFDNIIPHYDLQLLLMVLIHSLISEVSFTIIHKLLHSYLPHIHKIHHCCITASETSNLIFHPLDSVLEVLTPTVINMVTDYFIFKDAFSLMVAYSLLLTMTVINHDEYLKIPHWYHHKTINSNYSNIISFKDKSVKDVVRNLIIY
jgi:hypothetical protein